MPYLMIDNFAAGIDLRKSALTAPPGTLRDLTNATITAGGEITKRKTLTSLGVLPAGQTHGLAYRNGSLYVFGTNTPGTVGTLPAYVTYQQLLPLGAPVVVSRVLDVQVFQSKLYVVARLSDNSVRHFYDGVQVTDPGAQGKAVRAHKTKLYAPDGVNLRFSAVKAATDWGAGAGAGAGIIDVTVEDAGETDLVGLEEYFGSLAVFGRTSVQIWAMDPDPDLSQLQQVLGNTGLVARNAVARFGSGDVLFLADTGIRSLRARDLQSAAAVNDVGAPVDELINARRSVLTPDEAETITALVDPLTGHYWLIWGQQAIVLSAYPNSKISAWAVFDFGLTMDAATQAGSRVALRSGDGIYIYGSVPPSGNPFDPNTPIGVNAEVYDASAVAVETPFMNASSPASIKEWKSADFSCTGVWDVYICADPPRGGLSDLPVVWTKIAQIGGPTWDVGSLPIEFQGTHIALRLISVGDGPATLASMALHYSEGGSD